MSNAKTYVVEMLKPGYPAPMHEVIVRARLATKSERTNGTDRDTLSPNAICWAQWVAENIKDAREGFALAQAGLVTQRERIVYRPW